MLQHCNSLSNKMDNSLLAVRNINHKYIVVDGIFEIRCKVGTDLTRVLYFFYYDKKIILTNGFVKKTQRTPAREIILAKKRRKDYLERMG